MDDLRKFLIGLLVIDLVIVNAIAGYLLYQSLNKKEPVSEPKLSDELNVETEFTETPNCTEVCTQIIDKKIADLDIRSYLEDINTQVDEVIPTQPIQTVSQESKRMVSYVPVPGTGSTLSNDWVTLEGTDFYLSKGDYPDITEVYFEANMYLKNGNGSAYVRLFDVTHGVGVDGSQVETSAQDSTFVSSSKISLWDGYNHYVVQARSLTADTTFFESGRLKIIQEN